MQNLSFYNKLSTAKKAGLWFTVINLFNSGLNIITTPLFTRILSESDIGTFSVYNSWYSLFSVIVTLNLSSGIYEVLLVEKEDDKNNVSFSLLSLTLSMCGIWALVALVFLQPLQVLLDMNSQYIIMMIIEIATNAVVSFYITRRKFEYSYKSCALISIPLALLRTVVSVFLVLVVQGDKVFLRILGNVVVLILFSFILGPVVLRHDSLRAVNRYWYVGLKNNVVLLPHYISGILLASSDRVMISRIIGADKAGIYSIIYSFSFLVSVLFNAVSSAFTPYCYKAFKEQNDTALKETCVKLCVAMSLVCAMVISVAPEAITFFAPASYYEAVDLVPVLILGAFFTFLYNIFSCAEFYYHKSIFTTIATFVGAAINIGLNAAFLPVLGYKVAAYTTMFGYFVMMAGHYIVAYKIMKRDVFGIKWILADLVFIICFSIIMCALYPTRVIRYLILIVLLAISYRERKLILSVMK